MTNIIPVESLQDPRLNVFRNLRGTSQTAFESETFVVEGRWCVQRLAESDHAIRSVLVEQGQEEIAASWVGVTTPIYRVPIDQMRSLVGYDFHRGMVACGERPPLVSAEQLQLGGDRPSLALAVIGVDLKENLGSMLRSAAALGVRDILIGPRTADPFSRRTVRVSMAAVFQQTIYALKDPVPQLMHLAAQQGYRTLVTTLRQATPLDQFVNDDRPSILIVGGEANGVPADVETVATDRITIPMQLGTDSLNVAVATAIFLYELTRLTK